jgi:KDO2-lipid IV(A) lauroyltransferase
VKSLPTYLGLALLWLIHWLPLALQSTLGAALGALLYRVARGRRRVARRNLELCFPELDAAARERLVRAHFRVAAQAMLDHGLLFFAAGSRLDRLVRLEGVEHLEAARAAGPVIVLAPHFVGLDMGGVRLTRHMRIVSIYQKLRNPVFDRRLLHARTRFHASPMFSRHDGVRPVLRALKDGLPLYHLPDQDFGRRGAVFAPFFGVPAATVTALSDLARLSGARVTPLVTRRLPGGAGYVATFHPAWPDFPSGDAAADTARMNRWIEDRVRDMPEQYLWLHKRFKTRPPGEPSFYA